MASGRSGLAKWEVYPVTPARWRDLEALFGARGACGGCWCMAWRRPRSVFTEQKGAGNKRALHRLIKTGPPPGLLAYAGGVPIAWCALGPRADYPVLERSRVLKPIDDEPVWSIVCFFVAKPFRRRGVSVKLLRAAVRHARAQGARIVEGYPVEPKAGPWADAFVWVGTASAFRQAGFEEVARRSKSRPIMRRVMGRRKGR
jgi:GNAT superfamily N-acetyltransferase